MDAESPSSSPQQATGGTALEQREQATNKIFPLNLTAKAEYLVPGNPVTSRLEDTVANCFPGLELDVRSLDRRFFPGMVFEFIDSGARLAYLDLYQDPELGQTAQPPEPAAWREQLFKDLRDAEDPLADGHWFLKVLRQGTDEVDVSGFEGMQVWRFVRGLAADGGELAVTLEQRQDRAGMQVKADAPTATFVGRRRRYTDARSGVIDSVYEPGELTQGLCSPWQHDFRDCACHYWAANHPDVVLPEAFPGEDSLEPELPLDWLRTQRQRGREAEARETFAQNRPYQMDHFQINREWQQLKVVVEGREIESVYTPPTADTANPFASADELRQWLEYLAKLELALAFEYLYARQSVLDPPPAEASASLRDAVDLVRMRMLLVASSEMQHLRWVNQILWLLQQSKVIERYVPLLDRARLIPAAPASVVAVRGMSRQQQRLEAYGAWLESRAPVVPSLPPEGDGPAEGFRQPALRRLTLPIIDEFLALEHRSQFIDVSYARVAATLRGAGYPSEALELALRIVSDGVQHEKHFRQIRQALEPLADGEAGDGPWLRTGFTLAHTRECANAANALRAIQRGLKAGYEEAAARNLERSAGHIGQARVAMSELAKAMDLLAAQEKGLPFFDLWDGARADNGQ